MSSSPEVVPPSSGPAPEFLGDAPLHLTESGDGGGAPSPSGT